LSRSFCISLGGTRLLKEVEDWERSRCRIAEAQASLQISVERHPGRRDYRPPTLNTYDDLVKQILYFLLTNGR